MNAITTTAPPLAYGDLERLADSIAKSGLFGIKTKEQAIVLMMISHAEGRHPALAARDFDIINGRPAKKAEAMMRDFVQAGGRVEWHALTDELADATFTHPQTGSVRIDWDMKRAMTAFGKKDMYAKFPRQMLRSRVVSEGVRTLWPLATSGFHVPEEMADMKPEHNGPTLEAEAEAPPNARDAINREIPLRAAAAPMPRGARVAERAPAFAAPKPHPMMPNGPVDPNPADTFEAPSWLDPLEETDPHRWELALDGVLANCQSRAEVEQVGAHHSVGTAIVKAPNGVRARVSQKLATAYGRFQDDAESEAELPEIVGEARVGAG